MSSQSTPYPQQVNLRRAVQESYERLDADMSALLHEWEAVRAAYARVNGPAFSSEEDTTQTGEFEALRDASDHLLLAIDTMVNDASTRLPTRLTMLRGRVSGFAMALRAARTRRRALLTPPPPTTESIVRRHMLGTGA